jgi:hypothetical protein
MTSRKIVEGELTVGKYPRVKTLSRLVFPQAPSPIMTSFLWFGFLLACEDVMRGIVSPTA